MDSKMQPRLQGAGRKGSRLLFDKYFVEFSRAQAEGRPVVYLWIGANIAELFRSFDFLSVYPEVNALQTGTRKVSLDYIDPAEEYGYSPDICGYVKADVGLILKGMEHPRGKVPPPSLVFNNDYCNTYLKWSEILSRFHGVPLATVSIPFMPRPGQECEVGSEEYQDHKRYILQQLKEVVGLCEEVTGKKFDGDRVAERLAYSNRMADLWTEILAANKRIPAPFEAMAEGLNYLGIMNVFRGTKEGGDYLESVLAELKERIALGVTVVPQERFRFVLEGTPCWFYFREFVDLFHKWGAVFVFSTYLDFTAGGWDKGFRFDTSRPLESLADSLLMPNAGRGFASFFERVGPLKEWVESYRADGIVFHGIKSCRLISTGQADHREWLTQAGIPCLFVDSDVIDPRYFAEAQIRNRVEAFLEALEQKRFKPVLSGSKGLS